HAGELLDAPLIGFIEVDRRTEESTGVERIELAPVGVLLGGGRGELLGEEVAQFLIGRGSALGSGAQIGPNGFAEYGPVGECGTGGETREEPVFGTVPLRLLRYLDDLAPGRGDPVP